MPGGLVKSTIIDRNVAPTRWTYDILSKKLHPQTRASISYIAAHRVRLFAVSLELSCLINIRLRFSMVVICYSKFVHVFM